MTELHRAAMKGDAQSARSLLLAGAPPDQQDGEGWTALHYAAFKGHTTVIEALLANHACPDSADKRQWSPAHIAAQEGQTDALLALLRGGASSTSRTGNGNTPLHVAAQEGHASTVRALLQQAPGSAQSVNSAGQSALHCAAGKGRGAAVQALLEGGASAGALDSCGDTALHRCVAGWRQDRLAQYMACAKALLEAGADPAAANQQRQTPLDLAAGRGIAPLLRDLAEELGGNGQLDASDACATRRNMPGGLLATLGPVETKRNLPDQRGMGEELLRLGREGDAGAMLGLLRGGGAAVIGYAGADGVTALHAAAANGHGEMVKLLLDSGASAEAATTSGETALHLAAQCGCAPAIQALLAGGASGDRRNAQGSLPLHTAARAGQVSSVLALLAGGASPESTDSLGNTALHVAAGQGRVGIVAALLTGGAAIDARGPGGATPLMRAAAGGHLAAVRALLRAGASPSIRDSGGSTALHHAAQGWVAERGEGYASIARELLVAGCDPGVSNFQEETPLTIASRAGAKALKKLLTEASGGVYVESLRQSVKPTGVRGFWAQAFRNHPTLCKLITEQDMQALHYLSEVHYEFVQEEERAHRMVFVFFRDNPCFRNRMLVKQYPVEEDARKIRGTVIEWAAGRALTSKAPTRPCRPLQPGESFFSWFQAPQVPEHCEELAQEAQWAIQEDCLIAGAIGSVIQRALDWNSGAALQEYCGEAEAAGGSSSAAGAAGGERSMAGNSSAAGSGYAGGGYAAGSGSAGGGSTAGSNHAGGGDCGSGGSYLTNGINYPVQPERSSGPSPQPYFAPHPGPSPDRPATRGLSAVDSGRSSYPSVPPYPNPQQGMGGVGGLPSLYPSPQPGPQPYRPTPDLTQNGRPLGYPPPLPGPQPGPVSSNPSWSLQQRPPPGYPLPQPGPLPGPQPGPVSSNPSWSLQQGPPPGYPLPQPGPLPGLQPGPQPCTPCPQFQCAMQGGLNFQDAIPVSELICSIQLPEGCEVAVAALTSGKAAFEEQRYGQARQKFTSAMELDTSLDGCIRAEAALARSAASLKMYRFKPALEDAQLAELLRPGDARGAVAEGLVRMATKDFSLAKKCFDRAMVMDPDYPDIYELRQRAKEAIKQRWDKRVDTVKMFVGPLIGLGMTLLTL